MFISKEQLLIKFWLIYYDVELDKAKEALLELGLFYWIVDQSIEYCADYNTNGRAQTRTTDRARRVQEFSDSHSSDLTLLDPDPIN